MAFNKSEFRKQMKQKGRTIAELAAYMDKDRRTVSRYLQETVKDPKKEIIEKLCAFLGESPLDFDPTYLPAPSSYSYVGANVSTAAKNGYWLLKQRYNVSEKDILELAPLLFAIIAENAKNMPFRKLELVKRWNRENFEGGEFRANKEKIEEWEVSAQLGKADKIFGDPELEFHQYFQGSPNIFNQYLRQLNNTFAHLEFHNTQVNLMGFGVGKPPSCLGQAIDKEQISQLTGNDKDLIGAICDGIINLTCKKFKDCKSRAEKISWMKREVAEFAKGELEEMSSNPKKVVRKFLLYEKYAAEELPEWGVSASKLIESKIRELDELISRMTEGE